MATNSFWVLLAIGIMSSADGHEMGHQRKSAPPPIACNLSVFTPTELTRHHEVAVTLLSSALQVKSISGGYGIRFDPDSVEVELLAEFVSKERLCCPFFSFAIRVEENSGALWLELTGRKGVKEFILNEFGLNETLGVKKRDDSIKGDHK